MSDIVLTDEQNSAVKAISAWFKNKNREKIRFILAGLAGTGKTTIIKHIIEDLDLKYHQIRYCAFTGKAAMVMKSKGMSGASTIHSLIYEPKEVKTEDGKKKIVFIKKKHIGHDVKIIVCDEASMIGKVIQHDLESFDIPILYVGDHGQLPPVSEDVTNLMLSPDYRLDTIHRQALENPIIWIANRARQGKEIKYGKYGKSVLKATPKQVDIEIIKRSNQLICGKNASRVSFNKQMREYYGYTNTYPERGDKLICLKNNSMNGLVNGMIGTCRSYNYDEHIMDFESDEGDTYFDIKTNYLIFENKKIDKYYKGIDSFDFSYAITVHKSQGSEWENLVLYEERLGDFDFHCRWLYTGITRASKRLIIVS